MLNAQKHEHVDFVSSPQTAYVAADDISLAASASIRRLKSGETLYVEGEPATYCFQVVSGIVKEYNTLIDGRRQIADFYSIGDIFGISESEEYLHTAEAVANSVIRIYPREAYLQFVLSSRDLSLQLVETLMNRLHRAEERAIVLGRMCAVQRVATFLQRLSKEQGNPQNIRISMSRQDIADHLGLTIETVCRALTELKNSGDIQLQGARILSISNPKSLEDIACGESTLH